MTNLEMWGLVAGFFLPLVIAVLVQEHWPSGLKAFVAFVACVIVGAGNAYLNGQLNQTDVVGSVLLVFVAAITIYKRFWYPTGVAPAIESATSLPPSNAPPS